MWTPAPVFETDGGGTSAEPDPVAAKSRERFETTGRTSDDDVVVFKSNGIAAWDLAIGAVALARARERGVGRQL